MIRPILNLLSSEEQALIGQEKISRLLRLFFGIVSLCIAIGSILLLPSFFFLSLKEPSILRQIELSKQSIEAERVRQAEATIHTVNEQLAILFIENASSLAPLSSYLTAITNRTPETINMDILVYETERNTILLQGTAVSRDDFLSYLQQLKSYPAFSEINSPVTNLLQEFNLRFTITITLDRTHEPEV